MGDKTGISWTDATWNPVRGCSRVSEGCRNCYAERVAARFSDEGMPYHGLARRVLKTEGLSQPRWTGEVRLIPDHLADPLRWKKPRRIFVNSMSDLFHEKLTNEQIAAVFGVMAAAPQHTFQVLTKRATRMREWFEWIAAVELPLHTIKHDPRIVCNVEADRILAGVGWRMGTVGDRLWPLVNCWLGVSVENQEAADERIPELLRTPAVVRFLSCEPLIGAVDLRHVHNPSREFEVDALTGDHGVHRPLAGRGPRIDWIIAGCESGPRARPCDVAWLRSLRDQCAASGVPYFLKQAKYTPNDWVPGMSATLVVGQDVGSKNKGAGVIELPYLDGIQHAEFPGGRGAA